MLPDIPSLKTTDYYHCDWRGKQAMICVDIVCKPYSAFVIMRSHPSQLKKLLL